MLVDITPEEATRILREFQELPKDTMDSIDYQILSKFKLQTDKDRLIEGGYIENG